MEKRKSIIITNIFGIIISVIRCISDTNKIIEICRLSHGSVGFPDGIAKSNDRDRFSGGDHGSGRGSICGNFRFSISGIGWRNGLKGKSKMKGLPLSNGIGIRD